MLSIPSDETLVSAHLKGDANALNILFERYTKLLRTYIRIVSWYKDESFIDSILQHAFLVIFEGIRIRKFAPSAGGSFKAWAYAVCKALCFEENRRQSRQPRPVEQALLESFSDDMEKTRPETMIEPDEHLDLTNKIKDVLSGVPAEDLRILQLRLDGRRYEDILKEPDFQGWTLGQLRNRFYRLMELLRTKLKK